MVLPWRRRESDKRLQPKRREVSGDSSTGITYDRDNIERWFESGKETCPVTNQALENTDRTVLIPNHTMRPMIQDWCHLDHRSSGTERIPTPRVPLTPRHVSEIRKRLEDAIAREDDEKCSEVVGKIKSLGRESERSKKCLAQNGVVSVLSSCFERFAAARERHAALLEEIMSAIAVLLPVRSESLSKIGSTVSLRSIVSFLNSTEPSARQNAAFLLKEVVSWDTSYVLALKGIDGASEGLVKLIRSPVCPSSTKSSLMLIYRMISCARPSDEIVARLAQMGLVSLITDMIVNEDKSMTERALIVLDAICEDERGREELSRNDLIVPLLVKKILRVSDLATKCSISILWKLLKEKEEEESVLVEALQVGAFEKLLVVLQVGCEDETREKASELLRSLNLHRDKVVMKCVDSSMHLKYVKTSF